MSVINQTYDHIRVEKNVEKQTATIIFDRPEKMNYISMLARDQITEIFDGLNKDEEVRVIILKGEGDKAFSAGGSIPEFMATHQEKLSHLAENVAAPERSPKPVIAQLQGYTFGVGLELAMACDFRIAAEDTLLGLPEMNLGMIPGSGGTQRIAKIAGLTRAKDMIMRARKIPADEAYQWGLLTKVVAKSELQQSVDSLVEELVQFSPIAQKVAKEVLNAAEESPLSVGIQVEGKAYGLLRTTEDFKEGVDAFVEKRKPKFTGK
ncbi:MULTISPECIES: enoyl-CoA hydratase/isomerase family protein [Halalkalibacter]|uniref:2-oxoglutaroyl-CoA hydrolase n=1 Tax=Halalkalibacter nanhaiisediminis TaxID=688079 RepID=A0A562QN33_9BACI|nr:MULTISPECIES: enoyl-CoA hydratase-related protein [Halalkalibacter]MCM3762857.1 enoyl-CoA hydratase-related protein [Halalkalibacter oceani]TWI58149.1 2-oxoglutaroyl-CoA hydrolase [Halalkalibacter nanhaiisediminis]